MVSITTKFLYVVNLNSLNKMLNMKRRTLLTSGIILVSGCSGKNISDEEKEKDPFPQKAIGDNLHAPNYLGTHDSHEIKFKTIKFVQKVGSVGNTHGFYLDFGENDIDKEDTVAILYFYNNGEVVGAGAQQLNSADSFREDRVFIRLPDENNLIEYASYRISIVPKESLSQLNKNNLNYSSRNPQREREYCEDEYVPEEKDDPMTPNCNVNRYDQESIEGINEQEEQYFTKIEGYKNIEKD